MELLIKKASGKEEPFSFDKLMLSLKKSGAHDDEINAVMQAIKEQKPETTQEIHRICFETLKNMRTPIAARYNLKRALMELGPAGFTFEQFISRLFTAMGYSTQTGIIIQGLCTEHEVDILLSKDNHHSMVECKFHNRPGLKSDVKIPLYIKARFDDIHEACEQKNQNDTHHQINEAWLVCNTAFTSRAIQYGYCRSIKLLSWNHPINHGLAYLIEHYGIHPITALTTLSTLQKTELIKHDIVLCKDLPKHAKLLKKFDLSAEEIKKVTDEAQGLCSLK